MTLRQQLDDMLAELNAGVKKLKDTINENLKEFKNSAEDSFKSGVPPPEFKSNDMAVRGLGEQMEALSVKILSLQAPVSRSLRMVMASFRMIYDLQRISRDAYNAYKRLKNLNDMKAEVLSDESKAISIILDNSMQMLDIFFMIYTSKFNEIEDSYESIIKTSVELDDKIDTLFDEHTSEILTKATEGQIDVVNGYNVLSSYRSLERVGDHCCNLIERAIYIQTGNKVEIK